VRIAEVGVLSRAGPAEGSPLRSWCRSGEPRFAPVQRYSSSPRFYDFGGPTQRPFNQGGVETSPTLQEVRESSAVDKLRHIALRPQYSRRG
jgi:hypothetical protein